MQIFVDYSSVFPRLFIFLFAVLQLDPTLLELELDLINLLDQVLHVVLPLLAVD